MGEAGGGEVSSADADGLDDDVDVLDVGDGGFAALGILMMIAATAIMITATTAAMRQPQAAKIIASGDRVRFCRLCGLAMVSPYLYARFVGLLTLDHGFRNANHFLHIGVLRCHVIRGVSRCARKNKAGDRLGVVGI